MLEALLDPGNVEVVEQVLMLLLIVEPGALVIDMTYVSMVRFTDIDVIY